MAEQQNAPQQEGGEFNKVEQQFNQKFKTFVALVKGEKNLKKLKVDSSDVSEIVDEFLFEQREQHNQKFKAQVGALLGKFHEFNKKQDEAKKAYQKMVIEGRKEFIKEMDGVFGMVNDLKAVEKSYTEALRMFETGDVSADEADLDGGEDKA